MASQVTENVPRIALPDWTEYRSKNGRDPLGMQSSSVALYQGLLPGISNVTLRIRYYGLYAWLCDSYLRTIGDSNPQSWQRFLRRSEALYALIAQNLGTETGVAGTNWAAEALEAGETTIDFAEAAKPTEQGKPRRYLKQKLGVYGAAYASQLFVTGVFAESQGIEIPAPSREVGSVLAKSFQDEAGPLAGRFLQIVNLAKVTRDDLRDLSPLTPSSIRDGSDECNCYQRLLFATLLDRPDDLERSKTLKLILAVANRLMKTPTAQEVRWILYENRDLDGAEFTFGSPQLDQQRLRWWVYQANDLIHIAYESLLKVLLDIVERFPAGIGPERLLAGMVAIVRDSLNEWPDKWDDFLDRCRPNGSDPESEIVIGRFKTSHSWALQNQQRCECSVRGLTPVFATREFAASQFFD